MKKYYIIATLLLAMSCSDNNHDEGGGNSSGITGSVTEVTPVTSDLIVNLRTNKACYQPGEAVLFTADQLPLNSKIRYRTSFHVVEEHNAQSTSWSWTPPNNDFTGYLVDIYRSNSNGAEVVLGTIALDVSSDWTRFPRYGFVATFDESKKADGLIEEEMEFLNRCHINGVQFQDWHNKHHWPLGGTRNQLDEVYKDIANRNVYTDVVKKYIDVQHGYGMKSMFYNLCFGALNDADSDGVKEEWYIFKNSGRTDKDAHILPSSWKSSIYLLDPSNSEWQSYLAERNDEVYANFNFDGFHIDQLGNRGDRYDYQSNKVNMPKGYSSFLEAMKRKHPTKRLVMNAVSSYGSSLIASSGKMDFLYNEVWGDEPNFKDVHTIVKANDQYSNHLLKTVFAAYMNYEKDNGEFNIHGVLLTDAVMFALGGSHLELGDHMLCREYFPSTALSMSSALKTSIIRYYDFMTAYQNLLRDKGTQAEFSAILSSTASNNKIALNAWPPQKSGITYYAKNVNNKQVVHLLNFINADSMSWRDVKGTMPAPHLVSSMPLKLNASAPVNKVWIASPDFHAGAPQELTFEQQNGVVTFTLPTLKYWTMIVIE